MANVSIKFNGKEFLLSCDDGQEEHLEELLIQLNQKFNELKKIHVSSKIDAVISDSWKSLEVPIDFLKKNKIPVISLAHGNEIIIKNDKHHKRVKKILEHVNAIVVNSSYTKNLLNKLSNNFKNNNYEHKVR